MANYLKQIVDVFTENRRSFEFKRWKTRASKITYPGMFCKCTPDILSHLEIGLLESYHFVHNNSKLQLFYNDALRINSIQMLKIR